jgi:hypothetical protein
MSELRHYVIESNRWEALYRHTDYLLDSQASEFLEGGHLLQLKPFKMSI